MVIIMLTKKILVTIKTKLKKLISRADLEYVRDVLGVKEFLPLVAKYPSEQTYKNVTAT